MCIWWQCILYWGCWFDWQWKPLIFLALCSNLFVVVYSCFDDSSKKRFVQGLTASVVFLSLRPGQVSTVLFLLSLKLSLSLTHTLSLSPLLSSPSLPCPLYLSFLLLLSVKLSRSNSYFFLPSLLSLEWLLHNLTAPRQVPHFCFYLCFALSMNFVYSQAMWHLRMLVPFLCIQKRESNQ